MILVYIAGPYRSDTINGVVKNIQVAREHAEKLWKAGYAVLCPHLNTALFDGVMDDQTFLNGTMEMLKRCDAIYLLPKWSLSVGSVKEYEYAKENGIKIIHANNFLGADEW